MVVFPLLKRDSLVTLFENPSFVIQYFRFRTFVLRRFTYVSFPALPVNGYAELSGLLQCSTFT